MSLDTVKLASYVVLSAGFMYVIDAALNEGDKKREDIAAKLEFEDESTPEARKQMLLLKYPKVLVEAPGLKFRDAARVKEKQARVPARTQVVLYALSAVACLLLIGLIDLIKKFF